jgi:hypothetical protein
MTDASIQVVYADPGGEGYHCVYYMARLAAQVLGGELIVLEPRFPGLLDKLSGIFPPRKKPGSVCLLICPSPTDLNTVLFLENWRKSYGRIVAWVFDSFWTSNIPVWVRSSRLFDHIFVTEQEDLNTWRRMVRSPVDWLPWGSDALNLGSSNPARSFDLVRFGRQPKEWEDDLANGRLCQSKRISFHGRPPSLSDASDNERGLMGFLSNTKFTLAFSNRVSRSIQTHPEREYITGRWTDSLSVGASVAGIPPRCEAVRSLFWPEALLDLGTVDQVEGLDVIAGAVRAWTPERARLNYLKSVEVLDWRWRFKTIADVLEVRSERLETELTRLREIVHPALPASMIG